MNSGRVGMCTRRIGRVEIIIFTQLVLPGLRFSLLQDRARPSFEPMVNLVKFSCSLDSTGWASWRVENGNKKVEGSIARAHNVKRREQEDRMAWLSFFDRWDKYCVGWITVYSKGSFGTCGKKGRRKEMKINLFSFRLIKSGEIFRLTKKRRR